MDKSNKILVAAVLLIFVTLLSFNLDTITGSSTKEKQVRSVSVSPSVVEGGSRVTVTAYTGKLGMNKQACLYDSNSRVACTYQACDENQDNRAYKCYSTQNKPVKFTFTTSSSLEPGIYSICIWDYELAKQKLDAGENSRERGYVCGEFTITRNERAFTK